MSKLLEQINKTQVFTLGDVCTSSGGGTPSTTVQEYWNGDIPWLTPTEISNVDFCFISDTKRKITQGGLESSSAKLMPEYSILMTSRANIGDVVINTVPMTTNQGFINMIPNKDLIDLYYFSYWLRTKKNYFIQVSTGSTFLELSKSTFRDIFIDLPDLQTQKKIAEILSAYDAKIENNNLIIKKLEATAQTIFDEWFVNFRFPGYEKVKFVDSEMGEIPEGWSIDPLDDVAEFLNGVASQKYPVINTEDSLPVIKIREMNSGIDENSDRATKKVDPKYILENGDILFAWSGSLSIMVWTGGRGLLNQHIFKVTSEKYPKWLIYQYLTRHIQGFKTIAEGKATTMGHIQRHHLSEALVLVPDGTLLKKADEVLSKLFEKQISLQLENKYLKLQRDLLLAKLI